MNRRRLLRLLACLPALALPLAGPPPEVRAARRGTGAKPDPAAPAKAPSAPKARFILIVPRGGPDGLAMVPPHGDPFYRLARPSTALPPPGEPGGCLELTPDFGLHPALGPLLPYWRDKTLAIAPACGLPHGPRDHPGALALLESGLSGSDKTAKAGGGFLGRLARAMAVKGREPGAVAVGPALPPVLNGAGRAVVIPFRQGGADPFPPGLEPLYAATYGLYEDAPALFRAFREARAANRSAMERLAAETRLAAGNAPSVAALPKMAENLLEAMRSRPETALGTLAVSGFDTHVSQGATKGLLAERLGHLAAGLVALAKGLGPDLAHTTILAVGEFGRSLVENAHAGTDNGRAGVALVLGGGVAGGRLIGDWPGLSPHALDDGRDLAVGLDVRDIVRAWATSRAGLDEAAMGRVFPGHAPGKGAAGMFVSPPEPGSTPR